jgi:hypothetical protein
MPEASSPDGGIEITDEVGYFVGNFPMAYFRPSHPVVLRLLTAAFVSIYIGKAYCGEQGCNHRPMPCNAMQQPL